MSSVPPRPRVIRARDGAPRAPENAPRAPESAPRAPESAPRAPVNAPRAPEGVADPARPLAAPPTAEVAAVPHALPLHAPPELGPHLRALLADLAAHVPEAFGPVDTSRLLVVMGAARREARATIRPLTAADAPGAAWHKPEVHVRGVRILYEIALRPLYFRSTSAAARVLTLAHELWHAGPTFDGTLPPARRHTVTRGAQVEVEVREALALWRQRSSRAEPLIARATAPGVYHLDAWLCRPPSRIPAASAARRRYDDADLYPQLVEQR